MCWCVSVIPSTQGAGQETHEFEDSLGYIERFCLKRRMKERREEEEGREGWREEKGRDKRSLEKRGEKGGERRGGSNKRKLLRFCLSSDHSGILAP